MEQINRRKFIEKSLLFNGSILFGASWFSQFMEGFSMQSSVDYYMPIQETNPALIRWEKKCKGCRECIKACMEKQKVYGTYTASKTNHVCIHCGTCLSACTKGAITEKYQWQEVLDAIDNPSKIVIASVSPSVPVGIGDYFGMGAGSYLSENIGGACRALGFDYVLDTDFSADLTIIEEANEFQKRVLGNGTLPQFTSCCPAWVKYVEIYYPSLIKHLSTARSPIIMQGAMVKTYYAKKKGIDPRNIVHVAITPCTSKKFEVTRPELTTDGMRSTDIALTTNELAIMLKKRNIDLISQKSKYDSLMGSASGAGVIFGNTGGVMRAAIRTAYYNLTGSNPPSDIMELKQIQGLTGIKEATVTIGKTSLNVAVCYEMRNAKVILDQVMNGTCKYDFVEVMACEGGCVGGAGQPPKTIANLQKRIAALDKADNDAIIRFSHENPEIKEIYRHFLKKAGSKKAEEYLHTSYNNKSNLLLTAVNEKMMEVVK
jgi:ferredoxin hydrogenase